MTWQHTFDFTQGSQGWSATQGSHSGAGWVHGEVVDGTCKYRGVNLNYTLPRPSTITKIVATYQYVGGTAVCDPSAKNSTITLNLGASQTTNTMNWGADGIVTHVWNNLNVSTSNINIKAQCAVISTATHTIDAMANAGGVGTNSNLSFNVGQVIELSALANDLWNWAEIYTSGPTGWSIIATNGPGEDWRLLGVNKWSLLGNFGTGNNWFYIGTNKQLIVDSSSNLYFGMNESHENHYGNNSGSIEVTIKEIFGNSSLTLQSLRVYGEGLNPFIVEDQEECNTVIGDCSSGITHSGSDNLKFRPNQPISIQKGEKREESTDLSINSPSGLLNFTRAYRQSTQSQYQYMGLGWTHNHAIALDNSVSNKLLVRLGNGGVAHFTLDSGTLYKGDPGSVSQIDAGGTGNQTYTLTASDKSKYFFDANRKLTQRELPNGEKVTYTYYTDTHAIGLLKEAVDDYGRKLQFTYINNPSGFNNLQLWRVGDTDATGLDTTTPAGRYVEFGYVPEKVNGATISTPKALLNTVRDVRGQVWTYIYYGSEQGEGALPEDANKLNYLVKVESPLVDMTGGGVTATITIKDLTYTLTGTTVNAITQKLGGVSGNYLQQTNYVFPSSTSNITTETTPNDPIMGKTTTHYFADGVYAGAEDAAGNANFGGMNSQYRPTAAQDANGNVTNMAWSADGKHLEGITDALGNQTLFDYDSSDRLIESQDASNRRTKYVYVGDSRQPKSILFGEGNDPNFVVLKHQMFTYDSNGRVTVEAIIDPSEGESGTTPLQKVTRTFYPSPYTPTNKGAGLLESITQYERTSGGSFVVNDSTTYTYDGAGRVIKTAKSNLFGNCQFTYTLYDEAGNVEATACGRESVTPPATVAGMLALYDANQDTRVTVHEYDALGRRYKTISNAGASFAQTTLTVYDALNRVIRTIANYKEDTQIPNSFTANHCAFWHGADDNENLVTDTAYNARGMVRKQTDVLGNITLYGYDDAGRVIKTVQSASNGGYNNDYIGTTPDPDLSDYVPVTTADKDLITTNTYDRAGNLVMTVDVLGNKHFTVYDALNRPIKTIRNAKTSATVAKEIGDIGYVATDDPRSTSYTISTSPDRDMIETTEYDALGRVIRTARLIDNRPTAVWETTLYGYDALGRQVKVIRNASNPTFNIATDPDLSSYSPSSDVDKDIISTTTYDADGRVMYPEDVNGNKTYMVYDGLGRQAKRILNYVAQGNPNNWVWDMTDARWEDGANGVIANGTQKDENIISETHYDTNGRVDWTRDMLGRRSYTVYDQGGVWFGKWRIMTRQA